MQKRAEHSPKIGDITVLSPTRPENAPKYKGFCIDFRSSRRHSMSLHVEAPFVKNLQFFIFVFFYPKMDQGDAEKRIPVAVK